MPMLLIVSRPGQKNDPPPVELEPDEPELSLFSVYLDRWTFKFRTLFRWRKWMSSAVDICDLRQEPVYGYRVWSGGQGFTLRESGPEGHALMGVKPFDFALYQHATLIANLRERQASYGKVNFLEGTATLAGQDHWSRLIVEVRSEGAIFLTAEALADDEAGSEARQYANRIPRDRTSGFLLHPGGARF